MAWANQKVFAEVSTLPDEALSSYITNPEWTAEQILRHICNGASWYVFLLGLGENKRPEKLKHSQEIEGLARLIADRDSLLIAHAVLKDREVTINYDTGPEVFKASTILSQSVHHATEHRAQLVNRTC